jgi:hypothetical protein
MATLFKQLDGAISNIRVPLDLASFHTYRVVSVFVDLAQAECSGIVLERI